MIQQQQSGGAVVDLLYLLDEVCVDVFRPNSSFSRQREFRKQHLFHFDGDYWLHLRAAFPMVILSSFSFLLISFLDCSNSTTYLPRLEGIFFHARCCPFWIDPCVGFDNDPILNCCVSLKSTASM